VVSFRYQAEGYKRDRLLQHQKAFSLPLMFIIHEASGVSPPEGGLLIFYYGAAGMCGLGDGHAGVCGCGREIGVDI